MKNLLEAGYGYVVKTCKVSVYGTETLSFWGCACPLWWIGPSYGMETIIMQGEFGKGEDKEWPVMAQSENLEELLDELYEKAIAKFPEPRELPNGKDASEVYPKIYKKGIKENIVP